ncbi:helix-turn-helix domain-containing protein [Bacillus sp. 37MA]
MSENETKRIDANTTYVLCKFFECEIGDLIKLVEKEENASE